MVERKLGDKSIRLVRGDITEVEADAFVYDVTSDCKLGSGYGGAIVARGGKQVQEELSAHGSCATGDAVVTSGGSLKARHIIHANGPKFLEPDTEPKLRMAARAALRKADELGVARLAFPPLGTGLYQVPLELCAKVLIEEADSHLRNGGRQREIVLVAADSREFRPFEAQLKGRS
ncbi:MAG: macro domain-containing protein [Acidobacteriota bacterium]